jgi:DNA polymerase-2
MAKHRGWLLDLYPDEQDGLVLWFIGEDGSRLRFNQSFPITFYAAGPVARLRELWRYLREQTLSLTMSRSRRQDLFSGPLDVLAIEVANAALQPRLFSRLLRHFPDLDFFDADIPVSVRYAAKHEVFVLTHCQIETTEAGEIRAISALDSRWALDLEMPPLRILAIEPDCNPHQREPTSINLTIAGHKTHLPLRPRRQLLLLLQAKLKRHDPDVIVTNWGDTWLFPYLFEAGHKNDTSQFNLNRDLRRGVLQRRERSYYTYGQVVYRGNQIHLFGRWHIDQWNAMMYGQYGLEGVLEQARVTGLPVQEVARKSPGAGITAMQMQVALREEILVPYHKQQAEQFKSARDLMRSDRGGLVYQPLVGLHHDVAEIDFVSMYPSIMVHFNISPESVGNASSHIDVVPEIGIPVDQRRPGLVPKTLRPLLEKRIAIKERLATLNRRDCRYGPLKARSDALKWLLVVCFGYLGYKNARFGRIESHESVTAYGREALLQAKEAAEDMGFTVLHMYVDGLWVKRLGKKSNADFQPLLDEIALRTGLPIALEGIYRWIAFLPSRLDARVPVPNRYFGVFQDGLLKVRGIDIRRHDTAPFIAAAQLRALEQLARMPEGRSLAESVPLVMASLKLTLAKLRSGQIPLEELVITQTLSRPLEEYRQPSPAARAAQQLRTAGKELRPGQRVRFVYARGEPGVWAWDLLETPPPESVDVERYTDLLLRASSAILQPLDIGEKAIRDKLLGHAVQQSFAFQSAGTATV